MHLDPYVLLGGAAVGLLVGLTGAGGGALMTPMLILLFGVSPAGAISSDLVASVVMRPVGAAVHWRAGSVSRRLVLLLCAGSVPAALLGSWLLSDLGGGAGARSRVELLLGVALLLGALAMALRHCLDRRGGRVRDQSPRELAPRPLVTVLIGAIGGVMVGLTSVGAGSLMIVLLLFAYPSISAGQLVGTDLAQAVPLTCSAALGALIFGHVELGLTASLILGSVPAVLAGSLLCARVSDRLLRPLIGFVILASGLKYVGLGGAGLGLALIAILALGLSAALLTRLRPRLWTAPR